MKLGLFFLGNVCYLLRHVKAEEVEAMINGFDLPDLGEPLLQTPSSGHDQSGTVFFRLPKDGV